MGVDQILKKRPTKANKPTHGAPELSTSLVSLEFRLTMAEGDERAWLMPLDDRSRPVLGQQQSQRPADIKGGQKGERSQEWWAPAGRRLSRRVFFCLAILVVLAVLLGTLLPLLEPEKSPGHLSPQGFSQIVSSADLKGLLAALEQTAGTASDGVEAKTRAVGTEGYERSVDFVMGALSGGDRWLKTRRMYVRRARVCVCIEM